VELELYMELELDQEQEQEQEPASKEQELDRGGWAGGAWSGWAHTFETGWASRIIIHWGRSGCGGRLAIQAAAIRGGVLSVWNTKGLRYFQRFAFCIWDTRQPWWDQGGRNKGPHIGSSRHDGGGGGSAAVVARWRLPRRAGRGGDIVFGQVGKAWHGWD
jgi:hypothetical protein